MEHKFDWDRIWLNGLPWNFLLEVALRTSIMFIILLIVMKFTGKRGIKQLSVFESVIIIALGSAAGDPMFYEDVGLLPAIAVLIIVLIIYRFITWLTGKSRFVEQFLEGTTECIIDGGKFSVEKFEKEGLAQDEFFTELRLRNVEHLGQVKKAYLETTGDVSIYFYEDEEVKRGLPITPELFNKKHVSITEENLYSCSKCGDVKQLVAGEHTCIVCGNKEWVRAIQTKRIT